MILRSNVHLNNYSILTIKCTDDVKFTRTDLIKATMSTKQLNTAENINKAALLNYILK